MQKEGGNLTIGVLALQGGFSEHINHLEKLNVNTILVKNIEDLSLIDGLIIPGGESTAMSKLLKEFHLDNEIINIANNNLPIWGTCAGMILLAKEIENEEHTHLGLLDIKVKRNAYGRQINSFSKDVYLDIFKDSIKFPLVFIRAPYITKLLSDKVEILLKLDENIVAVREGNLIATSFHPELTSDLRFHRYFVDICITQKLQKINS